MDRPTSESRTRSSSGSGERERPPAVILGSGLTALGATRCLARAGIAAWHLAGRAGIERHSRWYRPLASDGRVGETSGPADGSSSTLGAAGLEAVLRDAGLSGAVLFPCSDEWAVAAGELAGERAAPSGARFLSVSPPLELAARLVDKAGLAALLEEAGVPHPRTDVLASPADLDALPEAAFRDAMLKPRDSQSFFRRFGRKAFRVHGREEAIRGLEEARGVGPGMMLQEYVPGPATGHVFVDGFAAAGRIEGIFARRRLRIYPPDFGNSSAMVSVSPEEVASAVGSVADLVRHTGYRGIFSAELKQDERDGEYRLLEVNVRPWWYVEFAQRCGVNVCEMAYRDAVGLPPIAVGGYRVGVRCVYPYYDFFALRVERRSGRKHTGGGLRSWWGAQQPLFAPDDPLPALAAGWEWLRGFVHRRARGGPR